MTWESTFVIVVIAAAVIAGLVWIVNARRLDRLHRTVIQSRLSLNEALTQRANAATEFAASGALDVASAILLANAAQLALAESHRPVAVDGLEDGPGHRSLSRGDRATAESNLSRTLRLVLDGLELEELTEEQRAGYEALEEGRAAVKLTRRFHNAFVDQARRLRSNSIVRLARMAGGAPLPQPVDMDDE